MDPAAALDPSARTGELAARCEGLVKRYPGADGGVVAVAGLDLEVTRDVDPELARRQGGYGRGRRMQIESDRVELLSGVRLGETLGSPISMLIWNRDWENWTTAMAHEAPEADENPKALRPHYLPRPGHADLVGAFKYDRRDVRDILERASARETAARVACIASSTRSFFSFTSVSVAPPTRITATPPASLAKRSCSFSRS